MPSQNKLRAWAGLPSEGAPVRFGRAQALYSPPNPDSTRKRCSNCLLWLGGGDRPREECFVHDSNVITTADMICGYHVYGEPMGSGAVPPRQNMQPLDPELSGLEQVPEGTSCESCVHYTATPGALSGTCAALYENPDESEPDAPHAIVHALGCCAAWRARAEK